MNFCADERNIQDNAKSKFETKWWILFCSSFLKLLLISECDKKLWNHLPKLTNSSGVKKIREAGSCNFFDRQLQISDRGDYGCSKFQCCLEIPQLGIILTHNFAVLDENCPTRKNFRQTKIYASLCHNVNIVMVFLRLDVHHPQFAVDVFQCVVSCTVVATTGRRIIHSITLQQWQTNSHK